jgi:hypothetical protein
MSSPKVAKAVRHPKPLAKPPTKTLTKTLTKTPVKPLAHANAKADDTMSHAATPSENATRLAAELERAIAEGRIDALAPEALQALTAAICKIYSAQIEAGNPYLPLAHRTAITSTDVMAMASGLLRATDLAVFELGMWQSWTGR